MNDWHPNMVTVTVTFVTLLLLLLFMFNSMNTEETFSCATVSVTAGLVIIR